MITLYYAKLTRSMRPHWLLEEIGAPYRLVNIDLAAGEQRAAEYLAINPSGTVPALVDGDAVMFESAAICMYLADKYSDRRLAPAVGSPARASFYQWILYAVTTIEPEVARALEHIQFLPEAKRSKAVVQDAREALERAERVLIGALQGKRYILGHEFSAADVMLGSLLEPMKKFGLLARPDALQPYMDLLFSRKAYRRAVELSFAGHDHE